MTKENFLNIIKKWNLDHPYDKAWRSKYKVAIFSPEHRAMCPVDMVMEVEEHKLYKDLEEELKKKEEQEDNHFVRTVSNKSPGVDDEYVPGAGNFLAHPEDSMSEEEKDELFDNLKLH